MKIIKSSYKVMQPGGRAGTGINIKGIEKSEVFTFIYFCIVLIFESHACVTCF